MIASYFFSFIFNHSNFFLNNSIQQHAQINHQELILQSNKDEESKLFLQMPWIYIQCEDRLVEKNEVGYFKLHLFFSPNNSIHSTSASSNHSISERLTEFTINRAIPGCVTSQPIQNCCSTGPRMVSWNQSACQRSCPSDYLGSVWRKLEQVSCTNWTGF